MPETWQDRWEEAAVEERTRMEAAGPSELLANIRDGRFGDYFVIWRIVAEKSTLHVAGWTLYDVLAGSADYLCRYHCAAALLQMMGEDTYKPVDLSAGHPGRRDALAAVGLRLAELIGQCPPSCVSNETGGA